MLYGAIIGGIVGLVVAVFMMLMKKKGGAVPRFSQFVSYTGDISEMTVRIDNFLASQGYIPCHYNIETGVYKKGKGVATASQYIKVLAQDNGYLIDAFVDIYGTESGLSGFTGAIPKKACKKVVDRLINLIRTAN